MSAREQAGPIVAPVVEEVAQRPSRGPGAGLDDRRWTDVCHLDQIDPEGGVAALVDGRAVAVFRTHDDAVHALDNYDPFCRASVLARGIVGTRTVAGETVPYVAMRVMLATFGVAMVPLGWYTAVELGMSWMACHLVALMVLCGEYLRLARVRAYID